MNYLLAVLCSWVLLYCVAVDGMMYEVILNSFEAMPREREDFVDYGTIRLTRKQKNTFSIAGSFTVFQNAGTEMQAHWTIYKIDFMGAKHKFVDGHGSLCQIIAKDATIYPSLLESSNLPPQDSCPFPKGNYTIYNYIADEEKFPPALPLSEWLMEVTLMLDGQLCGGFRVRCTTKANQA
ncbi:uncharacterized protein LOC131289037 [Anopheles ziemanni]|uniref:uncharacterized protein LOC131260048 n=1 Tax=Anopheles coustani TaxID=139045 RepID=UPI00265AC94B|nr:uncharacterized protein LOC131260048 [Anopheles coustani]XP_058174216.1 uncharacterized protein LOC131289037 [Anopheles ziemanni]